MDERTRVHQLLQRHGWNATSFQVLEPGFRYWFDGDDACVAYVEVGDAWVAGGAPIGPEAELLEVARRFAEAAAREGKSVCFFGTEARLGGEGQLPSICIGEQPVWDPAAWEATLKGARSLREQLRRARAKGVTVREVHARDLAEGGALRAQVDGLVSGWLASRKMAPMGFLVGVELFGFAEARRYFVAEQGGRLVSLLSAVPIYARQGWLIEDLLRDASAPNGTAELLVDAAMRAFAAAGSGYVTMGLAPLAGEVNGILRTAREWGAVLYDFDGVRAFKARLRPGRWDPIFLAYPSGSPVRALHAALRAFAGGGLLRFGLQTVLRGPPIIVRLLALLLVPWTVGLALSTASRWFPTAGVQLFWVCFDTALCLALFALSRRWRTWLAFGLAGAISADALATLAEAAAYNIPRVHSPGEAVVVSLGVLAPVLASAVLWGALSTRLRD